MLLHNRGVDEDDLEHDYEDGHPHDEGDDQANTKVVQKDLEKLHQQRVQVILGIKPHCSKHYHIYY